MKHTISSHVVAGTIVALAGFTAVRASAQVPFNDVADVGGPQRTINAGIISDYGALDISDALSGAKLGRVAWPYLFYELGHYHAADAGWTFVNPNAPTGVNPNMLFRWADSTGAHATITNVTPDTGPYWEVPLNQTSSTLLSQYQVLLLELDGPMCEGIEAYNNTSNPPGAPPTSQYYDSQCGATAPFTTMAATDVDKLEQYVDGGGVLWIDINNADPSALTSFSPWMHATPGGGPSPRDGAYGIPASSIPFDLSAEYPPVGGGSLTQLDSVPGPSNGVASDALEFDGAAGGTQSVAEYHFGAGLVIISGMGTAAQLALTSAAPTYNNGVVFDQTQPRPNDFLLNFAADVISQSNVIETAMRNRQSAAAPNDFGESPVFPVWSVYGTLSQSVAYGKFVYTTDVIGGADVLHQFWLNPRFQQGDKDIQVPVTGITSPFPVETAATCTAPATGSTSCPESAPLIVPLNNGYVNSYVEDNAGNAYVTATSSTSAATLEPGSGGNGYKYFPGGTDLGTSLDPQAPIEPYYYNDLGGLILAPEPGVTLSPGVTSVSTSVPAALYVDQGGTGSEYSANPANPAGAATQEEAPTGTPVAGMVYDDCDNVIAAYPTDRGLYTIFLGARGELLSSAGYTNNAKVYATKLTTITTNGKLGGSYQVYTLGTDGAKVPLTPPPSPDASEQRFQLDLATPDPGSANVYADYNVNVQLSETQTSGGAIGGGLDRLYVGFANSVFSLDANPMSNYGPAVLSSPVMDRSGNIYYTDTFNRPALTSGAGGAHGTNEVNSSIVAVRDGNTQADDKMLWRFRLPNDDDLANGGIVMDANGNDYSGLKNFWFVGPPVLDSRGILYAAATNGFKSAIIAIDTTKQVYVVGNFNASGGQSGLILTQPVPCLASDASGLSYDEFNTPTSTAEIPTTQFTTAPNFVNGGPATQTIINFNSFANMASGAGTQPANMMFANLSEPEDIFALVTPTSGPGASLNAPIESPTGTPTSFGWHTNVAWWADLGPVSTGVITGLALSGDHLYFALGTNTGNGSGTSTFFSMSTRVTQPAQGPVVPNEPVVDITGATSPAYLGLDPSGGPIYALGNNQVALVDEPPTGYTVPNSLVDTAGKPLIEMLPKVGQAGAYIPPANLDVTNPANYAAPYPFWRLWLAFPNGNVTAGNGAVVLNGSAANGLPNNVTQVGADVFAPVETLVTDQSRLIGLDGDGNATFTVDNTFAQATTNTVAANTAPATSQSPTAALHMSLNRPMSINQLSGDRFLMADSGNNRCVEVDRKGNVLWELSQFSDPSGLLPLVNGSHALTLSNPTSVFVWRDPTYAGVVHYLIADTGNSRIVDVEDYPSGSPAIVHQLDWVSNTPGRNYAFTDAVLLNKQDPTSGGGIQPVVVALVTNKRIAQPSQTGTLQPAAADGDGASIVMLELDPAPSAGGTLMAPNVGGTVVQVLNSLPIAPGSTTMRPLGNPTFLGFYKPDLASMLIGYDGHDELLYADSYGTNGGAAYDLDPTWNTGTWSPGTGPAAITTATAAINWTMTQTNYDAIQTPIVNGGLSATPATYIRTGMTFAPTSIQRVGTDVTNQSGSNVYTGRYLIAVSTPQSNINSTPVAEQPSGQEIGSIGGEVFEYSAQLQSIVTSHTFSRPQNSSPLIQPSSAVLAQ